MMNKLNDVIKEDNQLICRQDVIDPFGNIVFQQGFAYQIKEIIGNAISIFDLQNYEWYFTTKEDDPAHIWNTFIPLVEWRDKQIDSILDEEND
jgi:hypothetical protein